MVLGLMTLGGYMLARPDDLIVAALGVLAALALLAYHLHGVAYFWKRTMSGGGAGGDEPR